MHSVVPTVCHQPAMLYIPSTPWYPGTHLDTPSAVCLSSFPTSFHFLATMAFATAAPMPCCPASLLCAAKRAIWAVARKRLSAGAVGAARPGCFGVDGALLGVCDSEVYSGRSRGLYVGVDTGARKDWVRMVSRASLGVVRAVLACPRRGITSRPSSTGVSDIWDVADATTCRNRSAAAMTSLC